MLNLHSAQKTKTISENFKTT